MNKFVFPGVAGFTAVALGAFGAHGLESLLAVPEVDHAMLAKRLTQFDTAARYHLAHAVAMLAWAALPGAMTSWRRWVMHLFAIGIVFFSGSLYLLVLTNTPILGAITPIGGVSWLVAWAMVAISAKALG